MPVFELKDFTGGLNLEQSPYAISENEFVVCENFILDTFGLRRRDGFKRIDVFTEELSAQIVAVYPVKQVANTWIVIFSNGAVYVYDSSEKTKVKAGTITSLDVNPKFTEFDRFVCIAHGQSLKLIDLANKTLSDSGSPKAVDVLVQAGRVVICGDDMVWWSGIGDPYQWTPDSLDLSKAFYAQVGYKDAGTIIGMTNLFDDIIVFKTTGTYRITGFIPNISINLVTRKRTVLNNSSYFSFGGEVLAVDKEGIYLVSSSFRYGDLVWDDLDLKVKGFFKQKYAGKLYYLPSIRAIAFKLKNNFWLLYFYQTKTFLTWRTDLNINTIVDNGFEFLCFGDFVYSYSGNFDSYSPFIADMQGIEIYSARPIYQQKPIVAVLKSKKISNTYPVILKRLGIIVAKREPLLEDEVLITLGKVTHSFSVPKGSKKIFDMHGVEIYGNQERIFGTNLNIWKRWQYQRVLEFDMTLVTKDSLTINAISIEFEGRRN